MLLLPGVASYPIDTIRRRMMMTSGAAVKYRCVRVWWGAIVGHGAEWSALRCHIVVSSQAMQAVMCPP